MLFSFSHCELGRFFSTRSQDLKCCFVDENQPVPTSPGRRRSFNLSFRKDLGTVPLANRKHGEDASFTGRQG